jgi:hypothetical protein
LVKLCFPGRRPSDYNRYAGVLRYAEHKRWRPKELEAKLAETPNALAELSGQASRLEMRSPLRPSLYERGCEVIRAGKARGTFKPASLEPGELVLLIGEVGEDGKGVVRYIVPGQEAVLRRLIVSAARRE